MYRKRPDLICFVNGIPLVVMEFKRIDVDLHAAYNDNLRDYKDTIPHLFWYNAFILLSNGTESKVGSLTASWEHFAEWKRVHSEDEPPKVSLETILQALCEPQRLLDVVENFILFMEIQGGLIKILAKNHQYLGANNTIQSLQKIEDNRGKLGVFWHTQGSGKSISMLFFAQKVLRKVPGHWTFVVVTDRKELDDQIYKTFASTSGVLTQQEVHAEDIKHLRQLLDFNQSIVDGATVPLYYENRVPTLQHCLRLCDVDHRFRCSLMFHYLSRQAATKPYFDADHRQSQSRLR